MIIDPQQISPEALDSLVAEYCLRDWGLNETTDPLEDRKRQVHNALKQGALVILYSENEECAHITATSELNMN